MKHPKRVEKYDGSLKDLAKDIGKMSYDSMAEFTRYLVEDLKLQSEGDKEKGRKQLVNIMNEAVRNLENSADHIDEAWRISEPYMTGVKRKEK